jgi:hypothetical protein
MYTYGKDKSKLTGLTIIGRYLAKMALKQWKDFRWKDTEFLQQMTEKKIEETMKAQGYDAQEIELVKEKKKPSIVVTADSVFERPPEPKTTDEDDYFSASGDEDYFSRQTQDIENDAVAELTEEDKRYLYIKWGKQYRPEEWIQLEQLYVEMTNSYDIQQAGDINTLKLACKCSLKSNQLLDIGDIEGAQKATKMYESMMKSGKWTAAQIKETEEDAVDSIGQIVAICEADGFIPRYYTDGPQDKIDKVILDMQKYTHDLIINESGLGTMIETAMKQMNEEEARIKAAAELKENGGDEDADLFDYDEGIVNEEMYEEFSDYEKDLDDRSQEFFDLLEED